MSTKTNVEKAFDNMGEELHKMFIVAKREEFVKGGQAVIEILKGAMKVSNSKVIHAQWLDTAEKELKEFLNDVSNR